MRKICKLLFGDINIKDKGDYIVVPLKVVYIIYSIPFLLFVIMAFVRTMGAFKNPNDEKIGIVKRVLFHIANIFISLVFWDLIITIVI